jgi:hypothetical protein
MGQQTDFLRTLAMPAPNYFYRDAQGREIGPLPLPALAQLRKANVLTDGTSVRVENDPAWIFCRDILTIGTPTVPAIESLNASAPNALGVKKNAATLFAVIGAILLSVGVFRYVSTRPEQLKKFTPTGSVGDVYDAQMRIANAMVSSQRAQEAADEATKAALAGVGFLAVAFFVGQKGNKA